MNTEETERGSKGASGRLPRYGAPGRPGCAPDREHGVFAGRSRDGEKMDVRLKNRLTVGVTTISNIFIDQYLAGASGEYIKVYLYLMRHEGEAVSVEAVADALNHTESDVRRALAYWQRVGVLDDLSAQAAGEETGDPAPVRTGEPAKPPEGTSPGGSGPAPSEGPGAYGPCDMEALSRDEAFTQLVYIAQKYLNKTFTPTDCQILGNLYANVGIAPELLEYLMEYCAQNHHTSLRYAEKVALSWHEKNIATVEEARAHSRSFSKESFAVMKAMGLNGRSPADFEYDLMEKWFRNSGFTRELVVEACSRTIRAIHNPSFAYADRILTDWKEAGVRTMRDINALDKVRREKSAAKEAKDERSPDRGRAKRSGSGRASNRFHNLEEHGYDYDEMIWTMINAGKEAGGRDGA